MSLFKRKDSPYWWVKISVAGSKPIQRSTGSTNREQAAEYEAKLANSIWEQKRLGVKPRYLWQEAVLRHIDESFEKKSHKTQIYHFKWLSPHLDGKYIDEISRTLIDSLAAIRKKENVSNATVNRYIQAISTVLRKAAHEWEWLDRAPKYRKLPHLGGAKSDASPARPLTMKRWKADHRLIQCGRADQAFPKTDRIGALTAPHP